MQIQEIENGIWTWTAPHPDWKPENDKPGGWGQFVTSVLYYPVAVAEKAGSKSPKETLSKDGQIARAESALIMIDPLAPPPESPDSSVFWKALDSDVERSHLPLAILIGNEYHSRSAKAVLDRYSKKPGASLWGHESLRGKSGVEPTRTFRGEETLPGGVVAYPLSSLSEGEVAYLLPGPRTLVFADAVIGTAPGKIRVCPQSWATDGHRYKAEFRSSIRRLLDLDADRVIVSHGPPILKDGRRALAEALESPAWGE